MSVDTAALRAMLAKATPGPLTIHRSDDESGDMDFDICDGGLTVARVSEGTYPYEDRLAARVDVQALVACRNSMPELLAELDAARADRDKWKARAASVGKGAAAFAQDYENNVASAHARGIAEERARWEGKAGHAAHTALHGPEGVGMVGSINPEKKL